MAPLFPSSYRATDVRAGCKTLRIAPTLRQDESRSRLGCSHTKEMRVFLQTCLVRHVNRCLQFRPELKQTTYNLPLFLWRHTIILTTEYSGLQ
ncbi:hypothetical protein PoB_006054400 [Plakobranchus ocellatus]|uniref:Uncharacterized protein n=1 Tax=Plakobranchus ocellatus TaxID=259542 RepID=A0AAV4CQ72_9GAST|nr:hypothetical protein PoB_006054400 [Plakobranchus ocellatus]